MAEAIFQAVGYVAAFGAFVMLAIDRERLSRKLRRMQDKQVQSELARCGTTQGCP